MGWFSRKTPYKKVIEQTATAAFDHRFIDPATLSDQQTDPSPAPPAAVNELEAFASVYFLMERAFLAIPEDRHREQAREHLAGIVLSRLTGRYSDDEIRQSVIPFVETRMDEYHELVDGDGDPGPKVLALGGRMIDHCVNTEVADAQKARAVVDLYRHHCVEPARKLQQLDQSSLIKW